MISAFIEVLYCMNVCGSFISLSLSVFFLFPLKGADSSDTNWENFFQILSSGENAISAAPADQKANLLKKNLRLSVSQIVENSSESLEGEEISDVLEYLIPVFDVWGDQDKCGQVLAGILGLPPERVGKISSLSQIKAFEKELRQAVALKRMKTFADHYNYAAMERAILHLSSKYPNVYKKGETHLQKLKELKASHPDIKNWIASATMKDFDELKGLVDFRMTALVKENPEVNFKDLLFVRRYSSTGNATHHQADKPENFWGLTMPDEGKTYYSEIISRDIKEIESSGARIFTNDRWTGFIDLNFEGDKLLMTSNRFDKENRRPWDIFELDMKTGEALSLTDTMPLDTDSYDGCYLPDGRIMFVNTSGYQGVPCDDGNPYVGNLHLLDRKNDAVRRLTLDQDNNYSPTMLADGRVLYLRWEYTESAHYFSRILMHMNPDGTDQKEYYGSNSYWPNSLFKAKPIPGKPGMFISTVSGHHGTKRVGELALFDINRGRYETEGAIQKIPGYGKPVENITKDSLVNNIATPYFTDPYPLSETFFLASCSLAPTNYRMNIVFCDVFDNIIPLTATNSLTYEEPKPLQARKKPPVIPDRVDLKSTKATAYITNINEGRAMKGVPAGKAKALRVFTSEYSPRHYGSHYAMGIESNWDLKVIYGTTPVEKDGSVIFEVPANQPVTVQVLDEKGRALALMRSWFTAMPGETLSCIGCHEKQNEAPPARKTLASRKKPSQLTPWHGPARTFSFLNEIQPVLDKNCIACHNGDKKEMPNFASTDAVKGGLAQTLSRGFAPGSVSYYALHPYVRRNGPEGNYKGLEPCEFLADTSELIQVLEKGHHGVKLSPEEWDRLYTWIDMNVPYIGYWPGDINESRMARRYELHQRFTTIKRDYVTMYDYLYKRQPVQAAGMPASVKEEKPAPTVEGFPFAVQKELEQVSYDLGNNVSMKFRKIPAGKFVMGSNEETPAESPAHAMTISSPYWMGETEVSLEQYRQFDPEYKNGYYDMHWKDQVRPGYDMDENPQYPAIRITWTKAMEFCRWLSQKTGKKVTLPTEAQWEFAARAGSDKPLSFGDRKEDFSAYANLADLSLKKLAVYGIDPQPIPNADKTMDFVPREEWDDKYLNLAPVAHYKPNAFGLYDMIGNASEWTRSEYVSYPWKDDDRNGKDENIDVERVVRGGSWRDRPIRATTTWRWKYPAWRKIHNVGFRVIIED